MRSRRRGAWRTTWARCQRAIRCGTERLRLVQQQLLGGPVSEIGDAGVAQREVPRRHGFSEGELEDAQVRSGVAAHARFRRRWISRRVSRGSQEHVRQPGAIRRGRLRCDAISRRMPGDDQWRKWSRTRTGRRNSSRFSRRAGGVRDAVAGREKQERRETGVLHHVLRFQDWQDQHRRVDQPA